MSGDVGCTASVGLQVLVSNLPVMVFILSG
jgi:hypothetical protein